MEPYFYLKEKPDPDDPHFVFNPVRLNCKQIVDLLQGSKCLLIGHLGSGVAGIEAMGMCGVNNLHIWDSEVAPLDFQLPRSIDIFISDIKDMAKLLKTNENHELRDLLTKANFDVIGFSCFPEKAINKVSSIIQNIPGMSNMNFFSLKIPSLGIINFGDKFADPVVVELDSDSSPENSNEASILSTSNQDCHQDKNGGDCVQDKVQDIDLTRKKDNDLKIWDKVSASENSKSSKSIKDDYVTIDDDDEEDNEDQKDNKDQEDKEDDEEVNFDEITKKDLDLAISDLRIAKQTNPATSSKSDLKVSKVDLTDKSPAHKKPRTDSEDKNPRTDSEDKNPRTDSEDKNPRTDSEDKNPRSDLEDNSELFDDDDWDMNFDADGNYIGKIGK